MSIFFTLIGRIIPLYGLIVLGFLAGRFLKTQKETIASLLIYIIAPVVTFHGVVTLSIDKKLLFLPVIFFAICTLLCFLAYGLSKNIFHDSTRNLLAFAAGTGNTGYFGYPLVMAIFGKEFLGLAVLANFGLILFESSIGFYITARGNHSPLEGLKKLLKLPTLYAFVLAFILNFSGINGFKENALYQTFAQNFVGAYTVLGMMIIGFALAEIRGWFSDPRFLTASFAIKFIFWPLLMGGVISLGLFSQEIHRMMFVMSLVPLAANTVSFATLLRVQPEKAAQAVFLSTAFALFYIPLMITLFL